MSEQWFSLLKEKIFSVTLKNGRNSITLPEVLYFLSRDEVLCFDGLQFYQAPAWHAFLVQIASVSICRSPKSLDQVDPLEWEQRLLDLSGGSHEAWTLVVSDLQKPAFFQPPVPEGRLEDWDPVDTPDDMDVIMNQKNHDMKQTRMRKAAPEHWAYALVNLQTTEGFGGRENYGIVRMNSGYGSRSFVGVTPSLLPGTRFVRDVNLLVEERPNILEEYASLGFKGVGGVVLLWLVPWDGVAQLSLSECDPYFVEVCRRVRLSVGDGGAIKAYRRKSDKKRIFTPETVRGDVGDPWMPVKKTDPPEAISVSSDGWKAELIIEVLRQEKYKMARAQKVTAADQVGKTPMLIAQVLVRGQGKTQGWHERILPLPKPVRKLLESLEEAKRLGKLARERYDKAAQVSLQVLRPSILRLLQGESEAKPSRPNQALKDIAYRYCKVFEDKADVRLFDDLWEDICNGVDPQEGLARWANTLRELAKEVFETAVNSLPISTAEYYKRVALARGFFYARLNKECPSFDSQGN